MYASWKHCYPSLHIYVNCRKKITYHFCIKSLNSAENSFAGVKVECDDLILEACLKSMKIEAIFNKTEMNNEWNLIFFKIVSHGISA